MSPVRAATLVSLLCLVALVAAVGASALVHRIDPRYGEVPDDTFFPLRVPKLDVHQYLVPGTAAMAVRVAQVHGIEMLLNLSGGAAGAGLEEQLADANTQRGRVLVFMNLDAEGCCDGRWAARESGRLARGKALGARGVAIGLAQAGSASLPRGVSPRPPRLEPDSPGLERIWEACADLGLPVTIGGGDLQSDAWISLVSSHPRVTFIGPWFGTGAADPAAVTRWMDRLPNLWADLAAGIPELGRRPEAARQAILAHPDRVLFGTDVRYVASDDRQGIVLGAGQPILLDARLLGGRDRRLFFDGLFRFLETRDRHIPGATPTARDRELTGIGLPRRVLEQVYRRNAERLLRGAREIAG